LKIKGIIWVDEIIDKLAIKHNVSQNEVLEVFFNQPSFRFVEKGHRQGENVYSALGQTIGGRHLIKNPPEYPAACSGDEWRAGFKGMQST
jgi:uncharacterized protein